MAEQISRIDAEVFEVCLDGAASVTGDATIVRSPAVSDDLPRSVRPPARYLDLAVLVAAWRLAASVVNRLAPDVVFANPCRRLQNPPAVSWARAPTLLFCDEPRRVDYDPTALGSRNPRTAGIYGPLYAAERSLDRRGVRSASRVATNSQYSARAIRRAYGRDAVVLPMGAPDALIHGEVARETSDRVLSVGTLIPTKGHDRVIEAVAKTRRRRPVVIVAPRDARGERDRLSRLAAQLAVRVSFEIAITDEELALLYRTSFVTAYLAQAEPFGLASLEAQAAGCPVIVSREGGLPETVIDGVSGLTTNRDPTAIAAQLDLLDRAGYRERLACGARDRRGELSWSRSAAALSALLTEVAQR